MPQFLEKKIAGIPVYVWAILVIAAVAIGLFLRRHSSSSADALSEPTPDDASMFPIPGSVPSGAGGGGIISGGNGSTPTPQDNTEVLSALHDLGTTITGAIASIPIPSSEPSPPLPTPAPAVPPPVNVAPFPTPESPAAAPPAPPSPTVVAAPPAAPPASIPTPAPAARPGPVPGATFSWTFSAATFRGERLPAKSVWGMADKPLFLKHLGARGLTYEGWRANHSAAACRVFGDCA